MEIDIAEESCLLWSTELENECIILVGGEKYLNDGKEIFTKDEVVATAQINLTVIVP